MRILIVIGALLSLGAPLAQATATTHIWAPSTDVQAFGLWHITSDMYLATRPGVPAVTNVGLTVGVLPGARVNLELGADHKTGLGALDAYPLYGNAKLAVPEGALGKGWPALAAGVFDVGTKPGRTSYDVFYVEAARTLPFGRVSLGWFDGNARLLGAKENGGLLAAWERTVTEVSDRLWVCVEYMGSESVYGALNAGASWKFAEGVVLLGGYQMYNSDGLVDTVTLQVDVDF
jgi:hypothetical protein